MLVKGFLIDVKSAVESGLESARQYRERNPITAPAPPRKPLTRQVRLELMAGWVQSRMLKRPIDPAAAAAWDAWYEEWMQEFDRFCRTHPL
jgi:hypothetical protein